MDINKAFDSVWHKGLLYKLHELKTAKYLLHIIKNLLDNRQLEVRIDSTFSFPFCPEQGLPQGSPLSPFLYNIYCHDIYNQRFQNKKHIYDAAYILNGPYTIQLVVRQVVQLRSLRPSKR